MADGSIVIDTKLNIANAKRDIRGIATEIAETNKQMQMLEDKFLASTSSVERTNSQINEMLKTFRATNPEYQELLLKQKELSKEARNHSKNVEQSAKSVGRLKLNTTGVEKAFKNVGKSITNSIKGLSRMALALIGIRGVSSLIRSSISEWASSGNKEAQQLQANMSQLKQSIASGLLPVITAVLNIFYKILGVVNAIVKAFTGVDFLAKSTAKSTGATSKNAKGTLASFDELNTLNKSDDSGGGAGGIAGNLESIVPDFSEIEKLIRDKDWYGLGQYVAEQINKGMASIDWDGIQLNASLGGTGLAEGLNGLVDNLDWESVGSTIANGLNTALLFAYNFLTTFDFTNFGEGIATTINGFFATTDWSLLGATIGTGIQSAIDTAYSFIRNIDMKKIGESLSTSINNVISNINWGKLAQTISEGIHKAIDGITSFFNGIDWNQIGRAVYQFIVNIDWVGLIFDILEVIKFLLIDFPKALADMIVGFFSESFDMFWGDFEDDVKASGENVAEGLLNGIAGILNNLSQWIKEHIFEPFMTGIKDLFGISDEQSEEMLNIGSYIISGLLQGIKNKWEDIKTWFSENVAPKLKASYWTDKLNNMKEGIKTAFKNTFNGVIDIVEKAVNFIIKKINTLSWEVPEWVPGIGGSTFGFNFKEISIPRLAKGGVVYQPTQAIIGESGREAVLPLENNTEWMDELADRISENQSFSVNFEGSLSQLARVLNPAIKKEQVRRGRTLIGGVV